MLTLHHFDRSPFAWKVRMVLEEKKIPYTGVIPENKNEDPAFAKLNPMRLTPVLVLEDGRTVWESSVINEYLEDTHPTPAMLPKDPFERARVRMIEDSVDQYLYPAIRAMTVARFEFAPPHLVPKPADKVDHQAYETSRAKVHEQLGHLERALDGRTWLGGDMLSLADATLAPSVTGALVLHGILPDAKYPNLAAWSERIKSRPSYQASAPRQPTTIKE